MPETLFASQPFQHDPDLLLGRVYVVKVIRTEEPFV